MQHVGLRTKFEDLRDLVLKSKLGLFRARYVERRKPVTILCYPEKPQFFHILYAICHQLGCQITTDPTKPFDVAIAFHDATDEATVRKDDAVLSRLRQKPTVINGACDDVSKERVDAIFREVFGYGTMLDPRTHEGVCVQKSNLNALHDGQVITCPAEPKPGYIYQKLINNQHDAQSVMDIRIPVFGNIIPFSSHRYRSVNDRFDNTWCTVMTKLQDDLTPEEVAKVLLFCKKFGLDYGELDLLRDQDNGLLYIVDVNPSPAGPRPGKHMSHEEYRQYINGLTKGFEQAFLQSLS